MSILKNNMHEIFAQGLAIGMTAHAAYVAAGYKQNRGNAAATKANQSVSDRVREIKQAAAQRAAGTLNDVIAKLEYITFGGMSKFVRIDDSGQPKIDLSDCTPEDLDLLAELTPTVRSVEAFANARQRQDQSAQQAPRPRNPRQAPRPWRQIPLSARRHPP